MTSRRQVLTYGFASLTAGAWSSAFTKSPWPTQTVRFIVPLVAGGGADVAARTLADWLSKRWKQPVVIENRPGADGVIGMRAMLGSKDGHTLLFSPSFTVAGIEILRKNLPYDPVRDVQPIGSVTEDYLGVIVPPSFNVKTFDELIARARSAPNSINFITPPGVTLLLWQALQKRTGTSMTHVPYR
ncbi:MAG TPA: tripartite tricarboxylate transporter substrate binding protein, partial [Steroidobacteraceae bacterium]